MIKKKLLPVGGLCMDPWRTVTGIFTNTTVKAAPGNSVILGKPITVAPWEPPNEAGWLVKRTLSSSFYREANGDTWGTGSWSCRIGGRTQSLFFTQLFFVSFFPLKWNSRWSVDAHSDITGITPSCVFENYLITWRNAYGIKFSETRTVWAWSIILILWKFYVDAYTLYISTKNIPKLWYKAWLQVLPYASLCFIDALQYVYVPNILKVHLN